MKKFILAGAVALAALASVPASAQNLVTDGSFESGGFSAWTLGNVGGGTSPVVITYNNSTGYPTGAFGEPIQTNTVSSMSPDMAGNYVAYFSSDTANPDSLTQSVFLLAGHTYNIGFDYYAPQNGINNPNDATLSFLIGGNQAGSTLTAGKMSGTAPQTWYNFNTSFISTTTGFTDLTFQFAGKGVTAADFAIDRVYAIGAVPEPATWAMMIGGFGLIGGTMRRRRANTSVAFA